MHPRRLARQIARSQLEKAGATGYNKSDKNLPSYFSRNWRNITKSTIKGGKIK